MPERIQRKRTTGWRMPEGAIYVGRPTIWGNPFRAERFAGGWCVPVPGGEITFATEEEARTETVAAYRDMLPYFGLDLSRLRGHDLACWCPPDAPCHGDVLLELANAPEAAP